MKDFIFSGPGLLAILILIINIIKYIIVPMIKAGLSLEQLDRFDYWINFLIFFIENIFNEPGEGQRKKDFVKKWILKTFSIDEEELNQIIDDIVKELNRYDKL